MQIGVKPGQYGWTYQDLDAAWRAAEDEGFGHLSCFDHVTSGSPEFQAWDAPSMLIAMAGATRQIELTVEVLNASLRHPALLASQLAVAQAASGGRVRVGIGAGSVHLARSDNLALGIAFPSYEERLRLLERSARSLPRLWRGEAIDGANGEPLSLGPIDIVPPPVWVAGMSSAAVTIAAEAADGWFGRATSPQLGELTERVDLLAANLGRPPLRHGCELWASELDGQIEKDLARLSKAGIDTVTIVLHEERGGGAVRAVGRLLRSAGVLN
jgi:alkanesulfonate monooxygenase SsuD/methylene tetrahydromethanopterin reductase-like flavin-dependent oxidoreductase (luciferase family)